MCNFTMLLVLICLWGHAMRVMTTMAWPAPGLPVPSPRPTSPLPVDDVFLILHPSLPLPPPLLPRRLVVVGVASRVVGVELARLGAAR